MKIIDLRVNNIKEPIGFELNRLSLSWKVVNYKEDCNIKYTQIFIEDENSEVFDSGKKEVIDNRDYCVKIELKPRKRYKWFVQIVTDKGEKYKAESFFETGKMNEKWQASWLKIPKHKVNSPIIEKKYT